MPPRVIEHVLKGGQIPGIPRETLDLIVKQYMERMYVAAASAQGLTTTTEIPMNFNKSRYLLPLTDLPSTLVNKVLDGQSLPYLSANQTKTVKVRAFSNITS